MRKHPVMLTPHIGVAELNIAGWAAASSYTRMLLHSLGAACREAQVPLTFLAPEGSPTIQSLPGTVTVAEYSPVTLLSEFPGERLLRRLLRRPAKARPLPGELRLRRALRLPAEADAPIIAAARHAGVSVVLPLLQVPAKAKNVKTIGWIADFQHLHLPHMFDAAELSLRSAWFHDIARNADRVMLSSRDALSHFAAFAPDHAQKGFAAPFPSLFAFEPLPGEPQATLARFHVPEKFALVVNQFWKHKNHKAVVEAVRLAKERGLTVPVVMTGLPADNRDPRNGTVSDLLQEIARAGLSGQIVVLGQVDFADLVGFMRAAALIIQPSRFEGWSTTVQDAKALGRPLLCSDIAVHREQAPAALGFFPCDEPDVLAELLAQCWDALSPGPDFAIEQKSLAGERDFARHHGQQLLAVCREAAAQ